MFLEWRQSDSARHSDTTATIRQATVVYLEIDTVIPSAPISKISMSIIISHKVSD